VFWLSRSFQPEAILVFVVVSLVATLSVVYIVIGIPDKTKKSAA
jgi:hypothetical protein